LKHILSIKRIVVHESGVNEIEEKFHCKLIYISKSLKNNYCDTVINPKLFTINIDFFTEAQKHNTCLNRKVCIDIKGCIKNYLLSDKIYGNIRTDKISDVVNSPIFQYIWYINKDKISVCKDCEFRYMCLDCRQIAEYIFSQPNCKYNPYIAKWLGEEGYMSIAECEKQMSL
jgi:radical SAM protein with 4Fe4S-binding SPASM domain